MNSQFADYLSERRDTFILQWINAVRDNPDIPSADSLSFGQLTDHLPSLLDDLAGQLRKGSHKGLAGQSGKQDARAHGHHRWKQGYDIAEVLREIGVIHRLITLDCFDHYCGEHPETPLPERRKTRALLHEFFTGLCADSINQYVTEQQTTINRFTGELKEKNDALLELNHSRLRLMGTVSHELRNILNALTLAITVLYEETDPEERNEMMAVCDRNLSDMAALLNQLLDYSALIGGHEQLTLERIPLQAFCAELVSTWKPVAEKNGLSFKADCDETVGDVVTDRLKLRQIAGNLISNAIKYKKRDEKGGSVSVSIASVDERRWKLAVTDTGIGIAPHDMARLFNEFSRIQPRSDVSGSGLGLAITQRLVELLGGRIEVISNPGDGSRFEAILPTRSGHGG